MDLVRCFHDDELRRELGAKEARRGTAFTDCDLLLAGSSAVGIGTAEGLRPLSSV